MKRPKLILLIVASFFLCSCAVVDSTKRLLSGPDDTGSRIYYVGLSDIKLFSEPHSSKSYVAKLPLNDKVMRYKVENGYAYVKVPRTDQTGWVKNVHLIWKKASSSPKKPPEKELIEKDWKPDPEREERNASMFDAF